MFLFFSPNPGSRIIITHFDEYENAGKRENTKGGDLKARESIEKLQSVRIPNGVGNWHMNCTLLFKFVSKILFGR